MLTMNRTKLSMALFLASEVGFFGVLILAYLYYYPSYAEGPNAANSLNPLLTGIFTVALLASSFTLYRAQKSNEHGDRGGTRRWLTATVVLGTIFLAGQAWEYIQLIGEGVTISGSLFGTTFYTLTGFHGLHVLGGLIAIFILLGLALSGHLTRARAVAVETVELYWHFVDVVWVVIFALVYVWPNL
ncbi:MAG: cytochrome c oxidase subunit 3 [Chloroflexota bacterium]|nr:cytochrome c oxidase subunit 3 [Chloroflexota bacterium]